MFGTTPNSPISRSQKRKYLQFVFLKLRFDTNSVCPKSTPKKTWWMTPNISTKTCRTSYFSLILGEFFLCWFYRLCCFLHQGNRSCFLFPSHPREIMKFLQRNAENCLEMFKKMMYLWMIKKLDADPPNLEPASFSQLPFVQISTIFVEVVP